MRAQNFEWFQLISSVVLCAIATPGRTYWRAPLHPLRLEKRSQIKIITTAACDAGCHVIQHQTCKFIPNTKFSKYPKSIIFLSAFFFLNPWNGTFHDSLQIFVKLASIPKMAQNLTVAKKSQESHTCVGEKTIRDVLALANYPNRVSTKRTITSPVVLS